MVVLPMVDGLLINPMSYLEVAPVCRHPFEPSSYVNRTVHCPSHPANYKGHIPSPNG
jgi:hypothetical protein